MAELLVIDKRRLGSEGGTTQARHSLSQQSAAISVGKSAGNTAAIVGAQSSGQQTHGGGKLRRALHADRKELKP
jgi:hypothetical protein